jgi:hypothetical protein
MIKTLTGDILINIGLPTVFIVMTYILLAKWLKFEEINVLINLSFKKFKRL